MNKRGILKGLKAGYYGIIGFFGGIIGVVGACLIWGMIVVGCGWGNIDFPAVVSYIVAIIGFIVGAVLAIGAVLPDESEQPTPKTQK